MLHSAASDLGLNCLQRPICPVRVSMAIPEQSSDLELGDPNCHFMHMCLCILHSSKAPSINKMVLTHLHSVSEMKELF